MVISSIFIRMEFRLKFQSGMIKVENKYLAIIFLVIGAVVVEIFADRISDYLKHFENDQETDSSNKAMMNYDSSFVYPEIIKQIDESVQEYNDDKITEKTIPRCDEDTTVQCFGEFKKDDYIYIGEMKNNLPDGQGLMIYDSGERYRGNFKIGMLNGYAVYTDKVNRIIYDGNWKDDEFGGYGIYNLIEAGQKYEGYFEKGYYHGLGKFYYGERVYEGEWRKDMQHGSGVETWKNGTVVKGKWVNNMLEGYVEIKYSSGDTYKGNMKADKKHGKGVYVSYDGSVFDGNYKAGLAHGSGTEKFTSGEIHYGEYHNGELHGDEITKIFKDGSKEVGPYKFGVKHGKHTITDQDGYFEESEFRDGLMNGISMISWPQGDKVRSTYKDGFKHGSEIYYFINGDTEQCSYKEGRVSGDCLYYDSENNLIEVCAYEQNALIGCQDDSNVTTKMDKMSERLFGIVKDAAELVTGQ